jgi:hypothetical protein
MCMPSNAGTLFPADQGRGYTKSDLPIFGLARPEVNEALDSAL